MPLAQRVCDGAHRAAVTALGAAVTVRILDRRSASLHCVVRRARLRVDVVSQATAQAYTEFNTTTSHQAQVFGPGVHTPGQIPQGLTVPGAVVAVWIPAQKEIVATDASPTHDAGSYVTVAVSGSALHGESARGLARAIATSTFAAHPDVSS